MIIVAGTFRVEPDKMDALRPHAQAVIAATRQEPGCIVYSFAEDLAEPGLIRSMRNGAAATTSMSTAGRRTWRRGARPSPSSAPRGAT